MTILAFSFQIFFSYLHSSPLRLSCKWLPDGKSNLHWVQCLFLSSKRLTGFFYSDIMSMPITYLSSKFESSHLSVHDVIFSSLQNFCTHLAELPFKISGLAFRYFLLNLISKKDIQNDSSACLVLHLISLKLL